MAYPEVFSLDILHVSLLTLEIEVNFNKLLIFCVT